jgi:hypothetical protein
VRIDLVDLVLPCLLRVVLFVLPSFLLLLLEPLKTGFFVPGSLSGDEEVDAGALWTDGGSAVSTGLEYRREQRETHIVSGKIGNEKVAKSGDFVRERLPLRRNPGLPGDAFVALRLREGQNRISHRYAEKGKRGKPGTHRIIQRDVLLLNEADELGDVPAPS